MSGISVNVSFSFSSALFDGIESSSQKLTHPTASRPKGPKKRPPSTVLNLNVCMFDCLHGFSFLLAIQFVKYFFKNQTAP